MRKKLLQGEELVKRATELGVSLGNLSNSEPELQRRVIEAERHRRDASLWTLALVSAVASMLSAAAAWLAVAHAPR